MHNKTRTLLMLLVPAALAIAFYLYSELSIDADFPCVLEGRVTLDDTGSGMANIAVTAAAHQFVDHDLQGRALTNGSGFYHIGNLKKRRGKIAVTFDNQGLYYPSGGMSIVDVDCRPPVTVVPHDKVFRLGGSISGRVLHADLSPVDEGVVAFQVGNYGKSAEIDSTGGFSISPVIPGDDRELLLRIPGYYPPMLSQKGIAVRMGETTEVEIVLPAARDSASTQR